MDLDKINPYLVVAAVLTLLTLWLVWASMTTFSPAFPTPRTDITLAFDASYRDSDQADLALQPYLEGRDKRPRNIFEPGRSHPRNLAWFGYTGRATTTTTDYAARTTGDAGLWRGGGAIMRQFRDKSLTWPWLRALPLVVASCSMSVGPMASLLAVEPVGLRPETGLWSWEQLRAHDKLVFFRNERVQLGMINSIDWENKEFKWQPLEGDRLGGIRSIGFDQIKEVQRSRNRSDVLQHNFALLLAQENSQAASDLLRGVREILDWVQKDLVDRGEERVAVLDEARPLVTQAVQRFPKDPTLREKAKELMALAPSDEAALVALARIVLQHDPGWSDGWDVLMRDLRQTQDPELSDWIERRYKAQPTNLTAALDYAELKLRGQEYEVAQNAYSRAFRNHGDVTAGFQYLLLCLRVGQLTEVARVVEELESKNYQPEQLAAVRGTLALRDGKTEEAYELLSQAQSVDLHPDLQELATYNYGLAQYRLGQRAEALRTWQPLRGSVARLALATVQRKRIRNPADFGELAAQAEQLNALLALERGELAQPAAEVFPLNQAGRNTRNAYLQAVAEVAQTSGDERTVNKLARLGGKNTETLRWVAYGHFLAGRTDQLAEALAALPAADGWSIAVRCYLALGAGEQDAAAALYAQLSTATEVPQDYLPELQRAFDEATSNIRTIDFSQIPDGTQLPGWTTELAGTGIEAIVTNRQLLLAGTQAEDDRLAIAYQQRESGPVRRITMLGDLSGLEDDAVAGLIVLDGAGENGIAYGAKADGSLQWRQCLGGAWQPWQSLRARIKSSMSHVELVLQRDHDLGLIEVVLGKDTIPVLQGGGGEQTVEMRLGFFGTAPSGTVWELKAKSVQIQEQTGR